MFENIFVGIMIVAAVVAAGFGVWLESGKQESNRGKEQENSKQDKE